MTKKQNNSDLKDVAFYNPHDGLKGRDGGPYLDHVNRQAAEINRAAAEGREPDDLNGPLPADAGTPLVVAGQVQDNSGYSNPSMAGRAGFGAILTDHLLTNSYSDDSEEITVADPISVLPVDTGTVAHPDNVASQTIDGNPSVAGINAAATKGKNLTKGAK